MAILLGTTRLREVDTSTVSRIWGRELHERRQKAADYRHYILCHAQELTRQIDIIADCGLQIDIRKRIDGNLLSFNRAWTDSLNRTEDVTSIAIHTRNIEDYIEPLYSQLNAVFGPHRISQYNITVVQCDQHDYILFIEAHREEDIPFEIASYERAAILDECRIIYLALLKRSQMRSATDWEKAVHELASPLDFIYSNADFITRYLTNASVSDDTKRKKLRDFQLVAQLLIDRLHQFRFAFAGIPEGKPKSEKIDIYSLCMPITHLWHHEARRKGLRFSYDDLKGIPSVESDSELLRFVLFNLVSNAIKYSIRGAIIGLYGRIDGSTFVIGISNKGCVIREDERLRVFESGYRSEEAQKADARGMGIGLFVCRRLMKRLNGRVFLVRSDNEATVFEIEAPMKPPEEAL